MENRAIRADRGSRLAGGPALGLASLLLAAVLAEGGLRCFPSQLLPPGDYGTGRFDAELGLSVAGSETIYNKVRFVRRAPNSRGFMDVEHPLERRPGTVRVGFFGDSYVEAVQVPLEQTFFRLLPPRIAGAAIEPFGFGVSGWGTLHAFLAFQVEAPRYGIDRAVYVFVENDPADSSFPTSARLRHSPFVLAESSDSQPGYVVKPGEEPAWIRAAKRIQSRSLLAQVVLKRLRLLRAEGVQLAARPDAAAMTARGHPLRDATALPSAWPAALREEAARVTGAILYDWKRRAESEGRDFSVLYVPRGEPQLEDSRLEAESWLPWLRDSCRRLSIRLIDPSDALRRRLQEGARVYDDHWSPEAHRVVAGVLAEDLERSLR
jgi:hypothetical protein